MLNIRRSISGGEPLIPRIPNNNQRGPNLSRVRTKIIRSDVVTAGNGSFIREAPGYGYGLFNDPFARNPHPLIRRVHFVSVLKSPAYDALIPPRRSVPTAPLINTYLLHAGSIANPSLCRGQEDCNYKQTVHPRLARDSAPIFPSL